MIEEIYNAFLSCNQNITTDSRKICKNDLFFALKGPNFNGNEYVEKAISLGAKYAVIDQEKYFVNGKTFLVKNVLESLQKLALHHRKIIKNIPCHVHLCPLITKWAIYHLSTLKTHYSQVLSTFLN